MWFAALCTFSSDESRCIIVFMTIILQNVNVLCSKIMPNFCRHHAMSVFKRKNNAFGTLFFIQNWANIVLACQKLHNPPDSSIYDHYLQNANVPNFMWFDLKIEVRSEHNMYGTFDYWYRLMSLNDFWYNLYVSFDASRSVLMNPDILWLC